MQKDYTPSTRYSTAELDALDIPYKYRDFCQDDLADYTQCGRVNPRILENPMVYALPLSEYFTRCKPMKLKWEQCEEYREREVFEEMRKLFVEQNRKLTQ